MDGNTQRRPEPQVPVTTTEQVRVPTAVEPYLPVGTPDPARANLIARLHVAYIATGILLAGSCWGVFMSIGVKAIWLCYVALAGHMMPTWLCQAYWGRCPLTLLEEAYRTGEDQNSRRWKSLRRWHSHAEVRAWAFWQPFYVWLACVTLAATYALIGIFTP